MSNSTINQLPKSTVELTISIPWDEVKQQYEVTLAKLASSAEIEGFRKGKAPAKLVEEHIDKSKLYTQIIQDIIPKIYADEIKKHNLNPVVSPKIEVLEAKEKNEWKVKATLALKPKIELKSYKEKIRLAKKQNPKIWVPGQDIKKDEAKKPPLDELLKVLLEETNVEISDMLITEEANRLLADLIDQTKKLGLTIEQYLIAKGKTSEQIRSEMAQQAASNLKLQFLLLEIAESEKIVVTQTDIDAILAKVENKDEREKLKNDSYYLAHLIRQQKTIDFLANL